MKKQLRSLKLRIHRRLLSSKLRSFPHEPYPTVDLFYWRPRNSVNFGDELGRVIVELMLARKGYTLFDEIAVRRRLLAVGSVLHFARNDNIIWGSGRHGSYSDADHSFDRLDVRAVRGPRTQAFLEGKGISTPKIYGDPALLLPLLTEDRFKPSRQKEVALIPNLMDYKEGHDFSEIGIPVINPKQSWNRVVEELVNYRLIIASSLHGLIVAEAFGIPACYIRLSEREELFKYHDYYEGTGRKMSEVVRTIPEAIAKGGEEPILFDPAGLMGSFPYDIWQSRHGTIEPPQTDII